MSHQPLLQFADVGVRYGATVALRQFSLVVEAGRVSALLGVNGAGKTSAIRAATGLIAHTGRIDVLGHSPGNAAARCGMGVMPQSTGAWSGIRAGELIEHLARLYRHPHNPRALLQALGIEEAWHTTYRRLSGGQQQLINLAGALVGRPSLLVLDEPTAGLDPHARRRVWSLVRSLREAGVGILLTTHDMAEAESLSDTVCILAGGHTRLSGDTATVASPDGLEEAFVAATEEHA